MTPTGLPAQKMLLTFHTQYIVSGNDKLHAGLEIQIIVHLESARTGRTADRAEKTEDLSS
jgi:hypothetical protein